MADAAVNFEAAEAFLRQAKSAARDGNETMSLAARQMVAVALNIKTDTRATRGETK
jgi:hypothetical protein